MKRKEGKGKENSIVCDPGFLHVLWRVLSLTSRRIHLLWHRWLLQSEAKHEWESEPTESRAAAAAAGEVSWETVMQPVWCSTSHRLERPNVPRNILTKWIHKWMSPLFFFTQAGMKVTTIGEPITETYLFVFYIQISQCPALEWSVWSKYSFPLWKERKKDLVQS